VFEFKRVKKWLVGSGPLATPMELALWPGAWRDVFRKRRRIPLSDVKKFVRTNVGDGADLYSANKNARKLIVAFTDKSRCLLTPLAVFLQHLDDEQFDVLALHDRRWLHFDSGIGSAAPSLPTTIGLAAAVAARGRYECIVSYGASMGGFPALRAGHALKTDRSISVCGGFAWHVGRLMAGKSAIAAFDPLCDCTQPFGSRAFLLYPEGHMEDAENVRRVAAIVKDATLLPLPGEEHLLPLIIYRNGHLAEYHRLIFDVESEPNLARLRSFVGNGAWPALATSAPAADRAGLSAGQRGDRQPMR
jgi:hypothetical protein